jgi:peptidyl-prolyl cis-trans isomerase B (cyclophilin B)
MPRVHSSSTARRKAGNHTQQCKWGQLNNGLLRALTADASLLEIAPRFTHHRGSFDSRGKFAMPLPQIRLETSKGDITLELFADQAPLTVANFTQYVTDNFYTNTIFHRVIDGFMIQGGGLGEDMSQKSTRASVRNEANNGLSNVTGTVAMARTNDPHSASAQFFINVNDNLFLDHRAQTADGWGYCVFGKVVAGMDIVNDIKGVATCRRGGMQDVPQEPVKIISATVL